MSGKTISIAVAVLALTVAGCVPEEEMVFVPAGEFLMGSDRGRPNEAPLHKVYLPAFYIDRHEVTNREYHRFVKATGHPPPEPLEDPPILEHNVWLGGKFPERFADYPVVNITYDDAVAYAKWAGKRLPTEAEWEKAARGTDGRTYPWGNEFDIGKLNFDRKVTRAVGSFPEDISPYGCLDMAGNVAEWTSSWYKPYPGSSYFEEDYGEKYRVIRGGAYDRNINEPRCSARWKAAPDFKAHYLGFRCVRDARSDMAALRAFLAPFLSMDNR